VNHLLRFYLDGIPLDLADSILPWRSRFNFWLLLHLHLHAASQRLVRQSPKPKLLFRKQFGLSSLSGLIASLERGVKSLTCRVPKRHWGGYYEQDAPGGGYLEHKKGLVQKWLEIVRPASVWDLGANTGIFSRLASQQQISTLSFDGDPYCVELNYLECRARKDRFLMPLLMDLMNPSAARGWDHTERLSWFERGTPDLVMALAMIHHLAIANNVPLDRLASFFQRLSKWLIIEFVPKSDPNAGRLLAYREDVFPDYQQELFELEFKRFFEVVRSEVVADTSRVLYLMRNRTR
jgi:hypothetical protein